MTEQRRMVRMAELAVARAPECLTALGLGSCVAVVLYDPVARIGGMAHVLLPAPPPGTADPVPGRYAQTAVPLLVARLEEAGAERARLVARLAGGGAMFVGLAAPGAILTGDRNVLAVREALSGIGIPIAGEWVGGDFGRSVIFELDSGRVEVSSVRHGSREL
jgi:chemotaxis protein CheD